MKYSKKCLDVQQRSDDENNIKASITILVFNTEKFIEECLDSVISQKIKEKEIVCIDDGSSDNSYSILQKYQQRYTYIKDFQAGE